MRILGIHYMRMVNLIRAICQMSSIYEFSLEDIFGRIHGPTRMIVSRGPLSFLPEVSYMMQDNVWSMELPADPSVHQLRVCYKNKYYFLQKDLAEFEKAVCEYFGIQNQQEFLMIFGCYRDGRNCFIVPAPWNMSEIGLHSLPASKEMVCQNLYLYSEFRRWNLLTGNVDNTQHRKVLMERFGLN